MNEFSEIDELINAIKEKCPDIMISQLTGFGAKPVESGVWRFWHKDNESVLVNVEVQ